MSHDVGSLVQEVAAWKRNTDTHLIIPIEFKCLNFAYCLGHMNLQLAVYVHGELWQFDLMMYFLIP